MSRQRLGQHGKALERVGGSVMMTIRHEPSVYTDKDLAMLAGKQLDIIFPYNSWGDNPTREQSIEAIWEYENTNGRFTQKSFVEMITDNYYMALYDMGTDTHDYFDEEVAHHQVLLELVHRIFPKFKEAAIKASAKYENTSSAKDGEE